MRASGLAGTAVAQALDGADWSVRESTATRWCRAVWVDERLEPLPRDIYDETKLAAERLVAANALPSAVLRIALCFPEPRPVLAARLRVRRRR